ncbi:NAD(P)H-dependent glycerol-3-phosphate dehydrogenase [Aurantiacibacter poecillastricola]|uniref:NAD(P)H-dependent glycerol-3-phosphate dehydrogenase n=1 Tax=Aurantiacibacter poecillastricola TaxID=3064385 RepID=UPI00273EBA98|nr:NAD(P)H-dependent glycerol-3-phosphate dehydrogenase [Aurantiacibacter sp. 219JJ12-13]MDP5261432.1 NAD(P)H-dependent glycerol-3-phosphate dehydrogenase [Aurantiacibacter sp. 219JJ12-13]
MIGVVGAGAWGTALALMLAQDGRKVMLWAHGDGLAERMRESRVNEPYLPSAKLPANIEVTGDLADLQECDIFLMVTPAQHLGEVMARMERFPRDLVLCSKGIEQSTGRMMHQVARDAAPEADIAVLSGPTFAHEVAAGLPAAVTLACGGEEVQWERLAPAIARPNFRPYYSDDVIGAEIGGAVKNVLAIACGVVEGLGLGQNARNALITRGFAEMARFGAKEGASFDTMAGLCGLGDLVLTCSSTSSRNFSLGKALGEGMSAEEALSDKRTVAEGAHTAPVLCRIAAEHGVSMPITDAVNELLGGKPARDVVTALLARPLKAEGHTA